MVERIIEEDLLDVLSIYYTARIDIKNLGDENNSIEIIENSDPEAIITYPPGFDKSQGTWVILQSKKFSIDLKIKCINDGAFKLAFLTLDTRDYKNDRFPTYLDYTSIIVNGKEHLEENKLIWHDEYIMIRRDVKDNELITIHAEWKPFTSSSVYVDRIKNKLNENIENLNKEVENLKKENNTQKEKIKKLKNTNKKLEETLQKISNSSLLEIRKIKKEI